MLDGFRTSRMKICTTLLVVAAFAIIGAPSAKAADGQDEATGLETRPRRVNPAPVEKSAPTDKSDAQSDPLKVAYVLYDQTITPPETPAVPTSGGMVWALPTLPPINTGEPTPIPQRSSSVVSTAPMTAGEKFSMWFHKSFLSAGAYGNAAFNGLFREALDNDDGEKDTVKNYFADAATRAARSFTFSATAGLFEKAILPTLFKQDPRYHRSNKKGAGARIGYALTRVFVTQGDRCGCNQFNASFLIGAAGATAMANLWERSERTGTRHNISRFYTHIYLTALFNVAKEFLSGQ